jgi:hypothetical protein
MGKRFTDPQKWERRWFRQLTPVQKCFVMYLFDRCDPAGVWVVDMDAAAFFIGGDPGDPAAFLPDDFPVIRLDGEKKWFIPKFLSFQYESGLNSNKPAIVSVRKSLARHGLMPKTTLLFGNDFLMVDESFNNDSQIIKDKDKDKDILKGVKGENNVIDFTAIIDANAAKMRASTSWLEQLAMANKLTMPQLTTQLDEFITDRMLKRDARTLDEWRNHFVNCVRKTAPVIHQKTPAAPATRKNAPMRDELDKESQKHLHETTGRHIRFKDELTQETTIILKCYWAGKNGKPVMDAEKLAEKYSIKNT